MPTVEQMANIRKAFAPRKYGITYADLKAWRDAGESTITIASRFNCCPTTVRNWLIRLRLPTADPLVQPAKAAPGQQPRQKYAVYVAERRQPARLPKPKEA